MQSRSPLFFALRTPSLILLAVSSLTACTNATCGNIGPGADAGSDGGVAVCGNRACEPGESAATCPADCSSPPPVCGNHACEPGESAATCPADCSSPVPVCGNHACESGESAATCPADCSSPPVCGNHVCDVGESAATCPADCSAPPPVCGDAVCEAGESALTCPLDCSTGCPSAAGNYALGAAIEADPSCPFGTVPVSVAQSGCEVTVTGVLPTPITFTIDATGTGLYPYSFGGESGLLTFVFSLTSFHVTDTGPNALCPGFAIRS
jgi:hypothetical protein